VKDLLGRTLTPTERSLLAAHRALLRVLHEPDLPPCVAANVREAGAALWQAVNDLALRLERPEEIDG
jgi:hypothetical protein